MSRSNRPPPKDMYWFAHGGAESDGSASQRSGAQVEEDEALSSNSPTWNLGADRKGSPEESRGLLVTDGSSSSGPSSLERDDRLRTVDKRLAVEERRKQLWEAEQERNDAVLRKHLEREAALEARRNAQRSNISFAFGSSVPRNVETLHPDGKDTDIMSRSFTASGLTQKEENYNMFHDRRSVSPLNYNGYLVNNESHQSDSSYSCTTYFERRVLPPPSWLSGSGALVGDDVMSRSMNAAVACAPRGRRKNDLMPTVPYERTAPARPITAPSTRKRSVSMTRLDQLAQPRRHYVEANKANSSAGSGASSVVKDNIRSPSRPLSSASEHSGGSGRVPGTVTRRVRSSPRKPRPVSIAGTLPDHKQISAKPFEVRVSPIKRSYTPSNKTTESTEVRKSTQPLVKSSTPKPLKQVESKPATEKAKSTPRPSTTPKASTPKTSTSKPTTPKSAKQVENKPATSKPSSASKTTKAEPPKAKEKKSQPIKKKTDIVVSSPATADSNEKTDIAEKQNESAVTQEGEIAAENERNNAKRIISEEEAKAALAEKRRLAREQAEREAELERQRQEELRLQEEERLRKEEEEHRKMEEEQLRLLEEHRRLEEEKLRKAIEEQEQREEEERIKREEELRLKAEQERKAKEEAEKQRLELEEKLRKEEEERAERKKRLEKIMSRTRGKSSGTSPSGSISGSDQLDSNEHAQEGFSSGANSLDSNEAGEPQSEQATVNSEDNFTKAEISSAGDSMEANPTYEIGSENESLNSNELMMPLSETASQDNSLVIIPEKNDAVLEPTVEATVASSVATAPEEATVASFVTTAPETESTETIENQEEEKITSSEDIEIKSDVIPENEDKKLSDVDAVDERSESNDLVPETELVSNSELQENTSSDDFTKNQISQDKFLNEQQPSAEANLDVQLSDNVSTEVAENDAMFSKVEEIHEDSKDHAEIQFGEDTFGKSSEELSIVNDTLHSENNNEFMLPEPSSMPSNLSFGIDGVDNRETDLSEMNRGSSVSSDIKLPDPIYETSDDGSISSEKHQQYYQQEDLSYSANQDMVMSEDVFSEQAVTMNTELADHHSSDLVEQAAFAETQNPFSVENSEYVIQNSTSEENQFQNNFEETGNYCMSESMYQDQLLDALEQPREIGEENVIPSRSSTSSIVEPDVHLPESELKQSDVFYQDIQENKENVSEFATFSSDFANQNDIMSTSAYGFYSDKENTVPSVETQNTFESSVMENDKFDLGPAGDGASTTNPFSEKSESHVFQGGDFSFDQQQSFSESEQICNIETVQNNELSSHMEQVNELSSHMEQVNELSSHMEQISDVTLIKSDDNETYVGIISSIDHDQSSNDFQKPNLHNEQLRNNFEFASMTDSEENSSLDSNLSQVMTVENSERITNEGLNHSENSTVESNSSQQVFSNGEQHNPFETEHIDYYDTNSKTNVNIFSTSEMSNGHSLESSRQVSDQLDELHGFGQLDGKDILSVDHSKNNIFENVDAIDYGKVSPDPFLGKGNSKSGNPFLLQDDQKQVLMTPDFLN
ncbi:myb-like protein X isoform X1 [Argiope bruennichi]|uniref:myb-like protein X isoform X1 n=1 Tax=Argiope bruennichi TaxID=94029 RepID=UPI0024946005|nr:myb-like protein X isoform X1 [Argiope bruennichi]XP_055932602.1 myb-like protein X isoform X1 [Argiope bruennichi]